MVVTAIHVAIIGVGFALFCKLREGVELFHISEDRGLFFVVVFFSKHELSHPYLNNKQFLNEKFCHWIVRPL